MNTQNKMTHTPMSFDGFGINGSDEYCSRIATLSKHAQKLPNIKELGNVMAAAPELLEALQQAVKSLEWTFKTMKDIPYTSNFVSTITDAKAAILKATGGAQ